MTYTLNIRPKRQVTLPQDVLDSMGVVVGDTLSLQVENAQVILRPKKQVALDALKEIQSAFSQSTISESELQSDLKSQRAKAE